ncbi:MAG: hypothetical protein CO094_06735 [Anaerolineae bacterium CG_4_9_14_3_um_filter_57_17]|nr:MAG: hypothetical protein CO094_06735 [Anaerolineae bacterium CG_4_9_14_3_um_filter_57_17]
MVKSGRFPGAGAVALGAIGTKLTVVSIFTCMTAVTIAGRTFELTVLVTGQAGNTTVRPRQFEG